MANAEIQAIIDARQQATAKIAAQRSELAAKKNKIMEKAAKEHRPPTAEEKAAAAECTALMLELNKTEETLILVTNIKLTTSAAVKDLVKQVGAANAALKKKTQEITKIVDTVNAIAQTIQQINAIVAQLGQLAAKLP